MKNVKLRLRAYRELAGMTQQTLGERLGVTRQTIAAWEKGHSTPTLAQIFRLTEVLGVQAELLLNGSQTPEPAFLFRADKPEALSPEMRALLARKATDYAAVERIMGLAPLLPESRPQDSYVPDVVEAAAVETRRWLGTEAGPLCYALSLLEEKGLKVILHRMPQEVSGFSAFGEELGGVLFVNAGHPVERRSFTALHEMAHLVFHRREYQHPVRKKRGDPKEKAANHFAGAVLLPREVLERELRPLRRSSIPELLLQDMKWRYHVSMRTILLRAEQIGLLPRGQAGKQIGYLKKKYGTDYEPPDLPEPKGLTRLKRLVFEALAGEKITVSRASEILGSPLAEVQATLTQWTEGEQP